jgi:hypothetical protein
MLRETTGEAQGRGGRRGIPDMTDNCFAALDRRTDRHHASPVIARS